MPKPSSFPASIDVLAATAVRWALERVGDPGYSLRCLAIVEDAFERANGIEPRLRGWSDVATILRGHRPRRWDDA